MPDPFVILQAMAAAALSAAAILLGTAGWTRPGDTGRAAIGWPLAIGVGFLVGAIMLGQRPASLPGTDKDRLLLLVVPAAMIGEAMLAAARPGAIWQWTARLALAALITPTLLHGSIYLANPAFASSDTWTTAQRVMILGGIAVAVVAQWFAVTALQARGRSTIVWAAVAITSVVAGITTMLSGYMSAGQLALPLAAMCGIAAIGGAARSRTAAGGLVVALACLASLLVMGRFFGSLSTAKALGLAAAPLLGWISESRWLKPRRP